MCVVFERIVGGWGRARLPWVNAVVSVDVCVHIFVSMCAGFVAICVVESRPRKPASDKMFGLSYLLQHRPGVLYFFPHDVIFIECKSSSRM